MVQKAKTQFLLVILVFTVGISQMYAQPPAIEKFFNRTFHITYGNKYGSGFMIQQKGAYYLVTAKHVVDTPSPEDLYIYNNTGQVKLEATKYLHTNKGIDVAVFKLHKITVPGGALEISSPKVVFGDGGFFFGYPYEIRTLANNDINGGYPMALVKRAGMSGQIMKDGILTFLLDGINNTGFSGGPVVFGDPDTRKLEIVGVISSYRFEPANVVNTKDERYNDAFYKMNTGIIYAIGIIHVQEIIDAIK